MKLSLALGGAVLAVAVVVVGLISWVRSGQDPNDEVAGDSGVEINYVDPETAESAGGESGSIGDGGSLAGLAGLDGLTLVARRPGQLLEFAELETLDGVTIDVARQDPAIPALPDIAATPLGLVLVDGNEVVLLSEGFVQPIGTADAVLWAGDGWVWLVSSLGRGELEAVLVDVSRQEAASPEPRLLDAEDVRAAPGLGLIVGNEVLGQADWRLDGLEIVAGGSAGVLATDGERFVAVGGPDAEPVEVRVPARFAEATFTALSPELTHVVVLDRDGSHLIDLESGESTTIALVAASPLRYTWLPDGSQLVWTEAGRVYALDIESSQVVELGVGTVAFSYGRLEVVDASELS